jgi:pimeloyl-ACP methyl ester carboxylesterase
VGAVTVQGRSIAFDRAGAGSPVVFLHGGLSDAREWRRQVGAFSASHDTIAWDAPGCGRSDDPPPTFGMAEYGAALVGMLDALEIGRVHLVGLSFGAALAIAIADRSADRVRSLTLASAYAGWRGSLSPDEVQERVVATLAGLTLPPDEQARSFTETLFTAAVPPAVKAETAAIVGDARPAGVRPMLTAMAEADLRDALGRLRVPVLLVFGADDVRVPETARTALAEAIPSCRVRRFAGAGHQLNLEAPERFDAEVLAFLREVDDADGPGA